jgi:hypothetical protein
MANKLRAPTSGRHTVKRGYLGGEMLRQFAHASLFALAFVGVSFGNSGLALAGGPPSVSVNGKAALIAPTTIAVVVDASCGDGSTDGFVEVAASQSSAIGDATGSGVMTFVSNGSRQQVVVFVDGGPTWNVGPATASAALYCGAFLSDFDLGAKITIQ